MEKHASVHRVEQNDILFGRSSPEWNQFSGINRMKLDKLPVTSLSQCGNNLIMNQFVPTHIENEPRQSVNNEKPNVNLNKELYKCQFCQELFNTKQALRHHKDSYHNERKTFRCTYVSCLRAFTSANYLKNHMDIEHTDSIDSRILCPKKECGLIFPNNYRLKRHIRQDHKQEKLYECNYCERKFASFEVRNNHINIKHGDNLKTDIYPIHSRKDDSQFYRSEQCKESENGTIYASSPLSSRLQSINGERHIGDENFNKGPWLSKGKEHNSLLSRQIDDIICDILMNSVQETQYLPLSNNELSIAILSLEEVNEQKCSTIKCSPSPCEKDLVEYSNVWNTNCVCVDFNNKHSGCSNRPKFSPHTKYTNHNTNQCSQQNILINGQNYPQSNTESEGHSTESQRSFFINSCQHEEFSELPMESHLKDVFSTAEGREQWSLGGDYCRNFVENPIKKLEYACLDTMFDDFHEIITSDSTGNSIHQSLNGYRSHKMAQNASHHLVTTDKRILSSFNTNDIRSKLVSGSHQSNDFTPNRSVNVPSNNNFILTNYQSNRRSVKYSHFINNRMEPTPYGMSPGYIDHDTREKFHPASLYGDEMNRNMKIREKPVVQTNILPNYPYSSMTNNRHSIQRNQGSISNGEYFPSHERSDYPLIVNDSMNSNQYYQNSGESDTFSETVSQNESHSSAVYQQRAPALYQAAYGHQMLTSQHSTSLSYCPSSIQHRNSCFAAHNRYIYELSHNPSLYTQQPQHQHQQHQQQHQQQQPQQQQLKQHQYRLIESPIVNERQGHPSSNDRNSHNTSISTENNLISECCEDSTMGEDIYIEQRPVYMHSEKT